MSEIISGRILSIRDFEDSILIDVRNGIDKRTVSFKKGNFSSGDLLSLTMLKKGDFIIVSGDENNHLYEAQKLVEAVQKSPNCKTIPEDQIELILAYSKLLQALRNWFDDHAFVEVRLPSIHFGYPKGLAFPMDFFGHPARLSGSNPLHLVVLASHLVKAYSIQKCFRAEPLMTPKHLAEFDMLEVAILGCNMENAMQFLEDLIINLSKDMNRGKNGFMTKDKGTTIPLHFPRIRYQDIGCQYKISKNGLVDYETELTKNGPVFIVDLPQEIAYWSAKPANFHEARSFNLLLPEVGEVAEGSEKQTRVDLLRRKFERVGLVQQLLWYCDGLNYPGYILTGFGLGIERLAMWLFGVKDIRNLHPFYRDQSFSEIDL